MSRSAARTSTVVSDRIGLQGRSTRADLIGEIWRAEFDPLSGTEFTFAVERRLMLAELLEQDHGQQVGDGKAAGCHMEV